MAIDDRGYGGGTTAMQGGHYSLLGFPTREAHGFSELESIHLGSQIGLERTVSDEHQADVGVRLPEPGQGLQEVRQPFLLDKARDRKFLSFDCRLTRC